MVTYDDNERTINLVKGVFVIMLFFGFGVFKLIPLQLLHIDYNGLSDFAKEFYGISAELLLITIIYFIFKKQYDRAIDDIKKNHLSLFKENFKYYLIGIGLMFFSNYLITILGGGISSNEDSIRDMFAQHPIYVFISSVFLAPILEESVFRLSFRNIFKNKVIFVLASGLVFGSLHLIDSPVSPLLILHLIAYSGCGLAFAYMLAKTNNILVSTGFHFMHNGILMSLQVLLLLV